MCIQIFTKKIVNVRKPNSLPHTVDFTVFNKQVNYHEQIACQLHT